MLHAGNVAVVTPTRPSGAHIQMGDINGDIKKYSNIDIHCEGNKQSIRVRIMGKRGRLRTP